ncbi:MAG TPA: translocation/assembly module TamB domain-containing protein, partial [Bryobacterales bacterium]|nr:translocation/assembly module TamB domain-containing protein [Bryobacterales bacterium]
YHADPRELRADDLALKLLGGEWRGRLAVDYADAHAARGTIEGRLEGVRLERAAEAFATSQYPLDRLRWAAVVGGSISAQAALPFSPRDASGQIDLTLSAPENPGALSPLQGVLRASYQGRDSEMQLSEARLATDATSVSATGRLREQGSDLRFRLQTARMEDLTGPAAILSGEKIEAPVRLDGRAVVQGRLYGTAQAPEVDAAVDLSRFAYEGRAWDSFTGRVQWSRRRLRLIAGRLAKDSTVVNADLTAGLDNGRLTDRSPLEADVSVRDTQLQDLAALAGQKVPVSGAVTAALKVQGTQKNLRGAGMLQIRRGAAWDEPFDSLRASIALDAGEVRLNDVRIAKAKSTVTGSGAFHPERKTFRFDARGENLELADLRRLSGGEKRLAGSGSFIMTGSGRLAPRTASLEELALEGHLGLQKVSLDGNALGDLSASVRNDAGKLRVDLQSDFGGGQISGSGEVVPRDPLPVQGRVEFRNLKVALLLRMAGVPESLPQIFADGNFAVTGEARRPETVSASGSLTRLEVERPATLAAGGAGKLGVEKLHSAEPVKWAVANRRLTINALHLVGEGSDLRSSGWAELRPAGAVNFSVRGGLNLAALGSVGPNLQLGGSSTVDAAISGPLRRPDVRGSITIQNASIGSEDTPISLSNGNGVIVFSSDRATIQKLTAEVGGGQVSLSGDAAYGGGPIGYHLRADARQVHLRYPRGLSLVLEGALTFTGTNQQSILGGQIQIARAGTTTALDLGAVLAGLRQPTRTPSRNNWLQAAQLNVNIVTAPDIRFETTLAHNLQADANLRVRGTALNPALLGRINITQGELQFQGTRYSLNRGSITFANPFRIEPILNLDLQTRVSGYDITLTLAGPLQNLNVSYRSDPPLPFSELITLLAVGRAPTTDPVIAAQQSAQARSLTQLGASSVIGQAIASPPGGSRLQRFFGVSRLKFDPELAGPEGNLGARVTLEQQVGRDITFTYVYNLASAQEQIVRVQWSLSRQFSVIAVRDQNGVFGVDFLYRRRYR